VVAFLLSGEMAIGYFMFHFPKSFFPLLNGGDGAVLYCFIFLYLALAGGGEWSVDRVRGSAGASGTPVRSSA
jgi:putative oxidoreductase